VAISSPEPPRTPPPGEPERYGPLVLERIVKDDGRALIRYSRERGEDIERP
jgi:hypothetical protein